MADEPFQMTVEFPDGVAWNTDHYTGLDQVWLEKASEGRITNMGQLVAAPHTMDLECFAAMHWLANMKATNRTPDDLPYEQALASFPFSWLQELSDGTPEVGVDEADPTNAASAGH